MDQTMECAASPGRLLDSWEIQQQRRLSGHKTLAVTVHKLSERKHGHHSKMGGKKKRGPTFMVFCLTLYYYVNTILYKWMLTSNFADEWFQKGERTWEYIIAISSGFGLSLQITDPQIFVALLAGKFQPVNKVRRIWSNHEIPRCTLLTNSMRSSSRCHVANFDTDPAKQSKYIQGRLLCP